MRILSLTLLVLLVVSARTYREDDSPHGSDFKISCDVCHSTKGWKLDLETCSFDHSTTAMPLTGQHTSVDCKLCHPTLVFPEAADGCSECHTDMHYQTVGLDCQRCHNTFSWIVNDITGIHRMGRFPLIGPHLMADCKDCHPSASLLRFEPLRSECIDCHREDYISATNPNHVQGNMSTECTECHSMHAFSWSGSGFNHLFFPLIDGHATGDCSLCHKGSDYSDVSSECFSCHEPDFMATTSPNHTAAGISTACEECHTILPGWEPAVFPMHDQVFALTQGHDGVECIACHINGDFANTSSECSSCHLADYNQTSNPNHVSAGLTTDCMLCHTTLPGWKPAGFPVHDDQFFPIYSGSHRGEWDNCSDCHTNPSSWALFSCTDCHEHSQSRMDDEHREIRDYQFNSIACLDCHPRGRGD